MVMYSSYFIQETRLSRYFRTLWNYIFMGTEFGKGGPILAAKNWSGETVFGGGPIFRYSPYQFGNCCFDYSSCCDSEYVCDNINSQCIKAGISEDVLEKLPFLKK